MTLGTSQGNRNIFVWTLSKNSSSALWMHIWYFQNYCIEMCRHDGCTMRQSKWYIVRYSLTLPLSNDDCWFNSCLSLQKCNEVINCFHISASLRCKAYGEKLRWKICPTTVSNSNKKKCFRNILFRSFDILGTTWTTLSTINWCLIYGYAVYYLLEISASPSHCIEISLLINFLPRLAHYGNCQ